VNTQQKQKEVFHTLGYAPCKSKGMYFIPQSLQGAYSRYGIHTSVFAVHKPQHLTKKRAQERDGEIIRTWLDKVEEVLSTAA